MFWGSTDDNSNYGLTDAQRESKMLQEINKCWADSMSPQPITQDWASRGMIPRIAQICFSWQPVSQQSPSKNRHLLGNLFVPNKICYDIQRIRWMSCQWLISTSDWIISVRISRQSNLSWDWACKKKSWSKVWHSSNISSSQSHNCLCHTHVSPLVPHPKWNNSTTVLDLCTVKSNKHWNGHKKEFHLTKESHSKISIVLFYCGIKLFEYF
jgi:hypothetical protein